MFEAAERDTTPRRSSRRNYARPAAVGVQGSQAVNFRHCPAPSRAVNFIKWAKPSGRRLSLTVHKAKGPQSGCSLPEYPI